MSNRFCPSIWVEYSKKLKEKILNPRASGCFSKEDEKENMRIVRGEEGSVEEGNLVRLSLLVDEEDGQIADARFQIFGETALMGVSEILCELLLRKNYDQARRISADLIDNAVRDKTEQIAFPKETFSQINLVLSALDKAVAQCDDITLPDGYVSTPVDLSALEESEYVDWPSLSQEEKLKLINEVILHTITPYIELDEGGIEVVNLDNLHLTIKYLGSCTTCHSATGSTLSAIQQILRAKVHPEMTVIPILN